MVNRKGFTLFEVVIVLIILSVLSSVAYPSLRGWVQRSEFKSEVLTLVGGLQRAKMEAIKANSYVVIEANSDGYLIFLDNSKIPGKAGDWFKQHDERQLMSGKLKYGLKLDNNFHLPNDKTRFNSTPGGKAGRFIITDTKGRRMDVVISSAGRIRVEEPK